jgi:hypothetical protein
MAVSVFKSFLSTINPFKPAGIFATRRVLTDPTTGAPVGIQNDSANGPDGIWTPIDITAAQVSAPTAAMLADLNATYRLNASPWTRYVSNGQTLVAYGGSGGSDVIPAWMNTILYSPLTITNPDGLTIYGQARVESYPT